MDKPVLIVDGKLRRIRQLSESIVGEVAFVVGAQEQDVAVLNKFLDAKYLYFYELRAKDLAPLGLIGGLRHLKIHWNTKLTSLETISDLRQLRTLILQETPKILRLDPLTCLPNLEAFEYLGGMWNNNVAQTLEPLAELPKLEELTLRRLRVKTGGLRPLGKCKALRSLFLSNTFQTADYAYLSVVLRDTECDLFTPWIRVDGPNGLDTMITGKRKLLNSTLDTEQICSYEEEFRRLQDDFRRT
ncbi:MAG TPA: hypothetical protein VGO67_15745 [Verrucomicrobiae bacterium]|jgi:hypothetical protein